MKVLDIFRQGKVTDGKRTSDKSLMFSPQIKKLTLLKFCNSRRGEKEEKTQKENYRFCVEIFFTKWSYGLKILQVNKNAFQ